MAYKYRVKYKESIETLEPVCELFDADNSEITMRFVCAALGVLALVFIFMYGNPGGGTVSGLLIFFVKFFAGWAALSIAAMIINKTVWRRVAIRATAAGDAEQMYLRRKEKDGKNITSQLDFYEDRFESVTKIKIRAFEYERVTKLLESDRAFGIVIKTDRNIRAVIGFPKGALIDADIEDLKGFLLKRCPKAKNKIKKL